MYNFEYPELLAQKESILLDRVPPSATEQMFKEVLTKFFSSEALRKNWSWSDRIINSCLIFPYCSLVNYEYDTERWLIEYFPEYWGKSPLYVCDSFSPPSKIYRFESGKDFGQIFRNSTLYLKKELFFFDEAYSYLMCYTELENILINGNNSLVNWVKERAIQLGEQVPSIVWNI